MERFFLVQSKAISNVCIYKKNLLGQDARDSHVALSYFIPYFCHHGSEKHWEKDSHMGFRSIITKLVFPQAWNYFLSVPLHGWGAKNH